MTQRDANDIARDWEYRERDMQEYNTYPTQGAAVATALPRPRGTLRVWVSADNAQVGRPPADTVTNVELQVKDESIIAYNDEGEAYIFSLRAYAFFKFTPDREGE